MTSRAHRPCAGREERAAAVRRVMGRATASDRRAESAVDVDLVPWPLYAGPAPGECVARCVLGMTLYTRHLGPTPSAGVARLFAAFLERAPRRDLALLRTSRMAAWHRVNPSELDELVKGVANEALGARVRHLFAFELADATDAPTTFFRYREADESRGAGSGYVQLGLAPDTPPGELFQLAMEAASVVPLWCGAAGFMGSVHPVERCTSYSAFWGWCRRYAGLDVQDPERGRFHAHRGLPGVGWLTLVSAAVCEGAGVELGALRERARSDGVECLSSGDVLVVRAGDEPTLGDLHTLDAPDELARAATALAAMVPEEPPRWYGGFWEGDGSARWARRFVEPEGWPR